MLSKTGIKTYICNIRKFDTKNREIESFDKKICKIESFDKKLREMK